MNGDGLADFSIALTDPTHAIVLTPRRLPALAAQAATDFGDDSGRFQVVPIRWHGGIAQLSEKAQKPVNQPPPF